MSNIITNQLSKNTSLIARIYFEPNGITINYTEVYDTHVITNSLKLPSIEKYANDIFSMTSTIPDFKLLMNEFQKNDDIMKHLEKLKTLYEPNKVSAYINENRYFEYKCILTKIQDLFNYKSKSHLFLPLDNRQFKSETLITNPLSILTGICRYFQNNNDITFASINSINVLISNSSITIHNFFNYEWIINLQGIPKSKEQPKLLYVMDTLEHINSVFGDKKTRILGNMPFIVEEM